MEVFITHGSALQYWRTNRKNRDVLKRRQRGRKAPSTPPKDSIPLHTITSRLSLPIDVTVSAANARRASRLFRPHVFAGGMPDRCLVSVKNEIIVASPELCFFQMASELPLAKLIELGYELCGFYALPSGCAVEKGSTVVEGSYDMDNKSAYNLEPLTNKKRLTALVSQMAGKHGKNKALRALRYIAEGSASPMETILAILLVLPNYLGGYGFALPEMNKRIDLKAIKSGTLAMPITSDGSIKLTKPALAGNPGNNFYKCDLYWKGSDVAAEYDSDLHHSGGEKISADSIRRSDLALRGIEVVPVTNMQMRSAEEFDKVARLIALKMGRRIQIRDADFTIKRGTLRNLLL